MSNKLGRDFRLFSLLKFAAPTMAMMVFMSLYSIVDGIFISRLVGSNALSSVNIVWPAIILVIAMGVMFASGGNALVSRKMGEKKMQEAREDFSLILLTVVTLSIVLMILGNIFIVPLMRMLGSTDLLMDDCRAYMSTMLFFAPATVLQIMFQTFFVTAGKPGLGLITTVIGGISNVILDYVFIAVLNLGVAGAALGTGAGQTVPAVVGVVFFFISRGELRFVKPKMRIFTLAKSCLNGLSEMVTNMSSAVVTWLFNVVMLKLLGENGVAAITIVLYGQYLFSGLYFGFSMGVSPVIAYNYGSDNRKMLRRLFKICFGFTLVSSLAVTILALASTSWVVGIFTPVEGAIYELTRDGFFLFSVNYFFAGINIFVSAMFTAYSDGPVSAAISFARTFVFLVASILLLSKILGVVGVWLSVPVAEALTVVLSAYFIYTRREKYHYLSEKGSEKIKERR